MAAMFSQDRPVYAAQDWAHLCTWDYFVGYWIYLQGQDKKIFTRHSLVLAFNSGAVGLFPRASTAARVLPAPATTQHQMLQWLVGAEL